MHKGMLLAKLQGGNMNKQLLSQNRKNQLPIPPEKISKQVSELGLMRTRHLVQMEEKCHGVWVRGKTI